MDGTCWRKVRLYGFLLLTFLFARTAYAQLPDTIHLTLTDWCPYTCANQPTMPGIVVEYVTELLARENITLKLTFLPWSRAVAEAQRGTFDGLLTAAIDEAPNMSFTRAPISYYQDCMYTKPSSEWQYTGLESLADKRLGVVQGYGYTELINRYIAGANESQVVALRGANSTSRLWDMLLLGRFDIFLAERRAVLWHAQVQQRNAATLRQASCMPLQPFYLALYPGRDYTAELLTRLDNAFADEKNLALWQAIQKRYMLEDASMSLSTY
ncbi:substrate-binding periplasmic protein [Gilvimarinus polysaccharolyticus]|uniref:substrate-binding periplasmic protein n=1 Tax=Gilvimarinus polysaccharolyticus TaxID=863921 RepID=UPI000673B147|nr:transporter substrate-binding domain-containing protein [Gilvimarinus polysaccharolyticus]